MEYTKIDYTVTPYHEVACQLLIDQLADLGFESFCDTETGFEAYIPSKNYKKDRITSYNVCYTKLLRVMVTGSLCGSAHPLFGSMTRIL